MNCRLGYVQQVKKAGHLGMAWHQGTCNGALRQCPHHHSRPSRASSTSNNHAGKDAPKRPLNSCKFLRAGLLPYSAPYAGHSGQTISPREYGAGNERPEGQLKGHIDIIMGPMFAGKTSELLRRVEDHEVLPCSIHVWRCSAASHDMLTVSLFVFPNPVLPYLLRPQKLKVLCTLTVLPLHCRLRVKRWLLSSLVSTPDTTAPE